MFDAEKGWSVLTVVDPDDNVLPVVPVAAIEATLTNLVFGEVPGIHDSKAAAVPLSTNIGLAVVWTVAAAGGTARVLETSADLACGAQPLFVFWARSCSFSQTFTTGSPGPASSVSIGPPSKNWARAR